MSAAASKLAPRLQLVKDVAIISNRLFAPGFATHALRLGPSAITPETLTRDDRGDVTLRYTIPEGACHRALSGGCGGGVRELTLSGLLAVVDEATTWALMAADRSRRPGLSTALSAELGPAGREGRGVKAGDAVDVRTKVVKIGRYMGFVNAEVLDVSSGDVVCVATHTKFMPMGLPFRLFMGPLFPLVRWISTWVSKPHVDASEKVQTTVDDLLQLQGCDSDATEQQFFADQRHMNPGGVVHGGCQAMLMELAGRKGVVKALGDACCPRLESISISFVSAAKEGVTLESGWVRCSDVDGTMKVVVSRAGNRRTVSEAFLKWSC